MAKPAWLARAEKDIGYEEKPVNLTKFGRHYKLNGNPWCAMAVSYWCWAVEKPLPSMQPGMADGYAAVVYGMQWAKAHGLWRPSWEAEPGDAIVYGWDGPNSTPANMHTGLIVESGAQGATGSTVEGNRDNRVGRWNFTVGERNVLGSIALTKLLTPAKIVIQPPKVEPQPRNPEHPSNTGPLADSTITEARDLAERLEDRADRGKATSGGGSRKLLRRLRSAIRRALNVKES